MAKLLKHWIDNGELSDPTIIPLVPIMTSNTTPSGVASDIRGYGSGYEPYRVFDGNVNTSWSSKGTGTTDASLTYKFDNPVCVKRFTINGIRASRNAEDAYGFIIKASNDGITYTNITDQYTGSSPSNFNEEINNNNSYLYYQICQTGGSNGLIIYSAQFYGH